VIGLLWVRHHGFFRELVRIDSRLIWLNIVYLGLVAFLPFPTELIGDNVDEPDAIVIYATTVSILASVAALMRLYADRAGLLTAQARREPLWSPRPGPGDLPHLDPARVREHDRRAAVVGRAAADPPGARLCGGIARRSGIL
jgi:Endosomal/lysosomal potassium channel TMEM175